MSKTWIQDRKAINFLEARILELGWMWREQPILDRGIDGQIEIVEGGLPSGQLLAVQSKGGESYFRITQKGELKIRLQTKHLRYWNDFALPVLAVGHLPRKQISYYLYIQGYIEEHPKILTTDKVTISLEVPNNNIFASSSKEKLQNIPNTHFQIIISRLIRDRDLDMSIEDQIAAMAINAGIDLIQFEKRLLDWSYNVGSPNEKSVALIVKKKFRDAEHLLTNLVEHSKAYLANQYAWLSAALSEQEKIPEAIKNVERAIELNNDDPYAWNMKGILLGKQRKYEEAISCFRKASDLNPVFSAPYYNWGKTLYDQKRYEEALKCFDQAIARKPDKPEAHRLRADCLKQLKQYDLAIESYNRAIEIKHHNPDAWKGLGDCYYYKGQFSQAENSYSEAITIDPDFYQAWCNRGFARLRSGNSKGALTDFKKSLKLKPHYDHALKGLRVLKGNSK